MKTLILALLALGLQASTVSSVTCAGGVATVTAANSFVASQGFELTGNSVAAYNVNSAVVSANSTSFTYNSTCNGTGTGGAVVPAQQILVISIVPVPQGFTVTGLAWNTTVTPTACALCTSQWASATNAQLAAIQAGSVVESQFQVGLLNTSTSAQMNAQLLTLYTNLQTSFNNGGLTKFAGYCYNGAWSAACN